MIDKKDILKMAKHVFRRGQGLPDKRLLHPKREWAIGLMFFVVVLVSGGIMSAQFFMRYQDVSVEGVGSGDQIPRYNQSLIQTALDSYQERKGKFESLQPKTQDAPEESNVEVFDGGEDVATSSSDSIEVGEGTDVISEEVFQEEDDGPVGLEAS